MGKAYWKFSRLMRSLALGLFVAAIALIAPPAVTPDVSHMVIDTFEKGELSGWIERRYNGQTHYKVVDEGGNKMLMAQSVASASALGKIVRFDPRKFSLLEWRWKIDDIIENGHALRAEANDHPAGIYVLFSKGKLPWQVNIIEYIWANALPQGAVACHPTEKNIRLVALQSGRQNARNWILERRNITEDYRKLFGEEPPGVVAVAIMTDTDQTGAQATAYYDDLILRR